MKQFYIQNNIGKVKYVISFHNGIDTHKDGSAFWGVYSFNNKKKLQKQINILIKNNYKEV